MSEVANKDLCAELYELSGWDDTYFVHEEDFEDGKKYRELVTRNTGFKDNGVEYSTGGPNIMRNCYPAYDLGYLLRKLPNVYMATGKDVRGENTQMLIEFGFGIERTRAEGDTPEDAACKLAIELFKQGVLKKEMV